MHANGFPAAVFVFSLGASGLSHAEPQAVKNPFEGQAAVAQEGHSLFNSTCAHCHGPDAITGISERNLRHFKLRYPDDVAATFYKTVTEGRPDKGMPTWGKALDDKTIWKIFTYLQTVQEDE